jgi:hypothetical protein
MRIIGAIFTILLAMIAISFIVLYCLIDALRESRGVKWQKKNVGISF